MQDTLACTKTDDESELSTELRNCNRRNCCVVEHCRKHHCKFHWGERYPLKSSGNKKVRVSVCLTAKADGMKMKPFLVFHGARREAAALNENFKHCCVVASSSNGWMNEELTQARN